MIHGRAWVKKIDRAGIGEVANAIVHCVVDVPASCLKIMLAAETHQCPIRYSYTAQAGALGNVDKGPCAIACTIDLRFAKHDWILTVECWPSSRLSPGRRDCLQCFRSGRLAWWNL